MKNAKPIIVIDDDEDDLSFIVDTANQLGIKYKILTFNDDQRAFDYLIENNIRPFIILCDINMPLLGGLELRKKINSELLLTLKSTPFIFLTTSKNIAEINSAFLLNIQGYFTKPDNLEDLNQMLKSIILYWEISNRPDPFAII